MYYLPSFLASLSPTASLGSYNTPSMIKIQPTSTRSIQPTSVYSFQQSPVVNIQSAASGSQSPQHSTDAALTSKHFHSTSTMQLQPSYSMKLSSTQAITNSFTTHQLQSTSSFQLQSSPPVHTSSTTVSNTKSIRPLSIASTSSVQSKTTSIYRPSVTSAEVFTPSPSVNIIQTSNAAQQMPPKKPMPTRPPTAREFYYFSSFEPLVLLVGLYCSQASVVVLSVVTIYEHLLL